MSSTKQQDGPENQTDARSQLSIAELKELPAAIRDLQASSKVQDARDKVRLCIEIAGIVLVLATAYFAFKNLKYMRESVDAANKAVTQATMAATAAINSNALAKSNAEDSQRAWIGVNDAVLTQALQVGQVPRAAVILENTGQTPALKSSFLTNWVFLPVKTSLFEMVRPDPYFYKEETSMSPHARSTVATNMRDSPNDVDMRLLTPPAEGRLPKFRMFIFGFITYSDIFGRDHLTTFCLGTSLTDVISTDLFPVKGEISLKKDGFHAQCNYMN